MLFSSNFSIFVDNIKGMINNMHHVEEVRQIAPSLPDGNLSFDVFDDAYIIADNDDSLSAPSPLGGIQDHPRSDLIPSSDETEHWLSAFPRTPGGFLWRVRHPLPLFCFFFFFLFV